MLGFFLDFEMFGFFEFLVSFIQMAKREIDVMVIGEGFECRAFS